MPSLGKSQDQKNNIYIYMYIFDLLLRQNMIPKWLIYLCYLMEYVLYDTLKIM